MGRENDPVFSQYYVSKCMSGFYRKQNMSFGEIEGLVVIIKDRMLFLKLQQAHDKAELLNCTFG